MDADVSEAPPAELELMMRFTRFATPRGLSVGGTLVTVIVVGVATQFESKVNPEYTWPIVGVP